MSAAPPFLLFLWPHRLLLLGPAFGADLHRHHAAQVCFSLGAQLRIRGARTAAWQEAGGFFVPPDTAHEFDAGHEQVALVLLEPESTEYRALAQTMAPPNGIQPLPADAATLSDARELWRVPQESAAERVARGLLRLPQSDAGQRPFDPRVRRALNWLRHNVDQPVRLAAVAKIAICSPSHFAHLFRDEVGVPLRRYVLWLRLRTAVELALKGASLTEAAHAAGFADGAHLSRTFRAMLGLTPSFLLTERASLRVVDCGPAT